MEAREKAGMKKAAWDAQYERLVRQNRSRQTAEDRRAERDALKEEAAERTAAAEKSIADLEHVLVSVVAASPVFEREKQRIASSFSERQAWNHCSHRFGRSEKARQLFDAVLEQGLSARSL